MDDNSNKNRFWLLAALGCGGLLVLALIAGAVILAFSPFPIRRNLEAQGSPATPRPAVVATQEVVATLAADDGEPGRENVGATMLTQLYEQLNPGVVNIRVYLHQQGRQGQGAGSGFILDDEGHIVTNDHVVAQADYVTVIFYDGFEAEAEIVGTDANSDIAILRVDDLPENVTPLALGNSDEVQVGEQVIAIGNPFGQSSSLTEGLVSAVGRTIASGTPFGIPQAIQTDAAINPGNSGGPLLNTAGEVIGVNAQIATGGPPANAGVGFAIPINVVRRIAPALIETGVYAWPWLGIRGGSVDLLVQRANDLPSQRGAYIHEVLPDGPAKAAGLEGSTGQTTVEEFDVPVGGDIVLEVDGDPIADYNDLLYEISQREPGDSMTLTILRDGEDREVSLELSPRPTES